MPMNASSKHRVLNISVKEWLRINASLIGSAGIDSAQLDAELLLCDALAVNREWLIVHSKKEISKGTAGEAVKRRLNREPLAYIRGWKEFYNRKFLVTKDVLIPRPESEQVIEGVKAISRDNQKIIDVGTGSGSLAITLALEIPNLSVLASDVSESALKIAKKNAATLGARTTFVQSDLLSQIESSYDIIVANLPYVDKKWHYSIETKFEPSLALFATDSGLGLIKKLITQSKQNLSADGFLLLEADPRQHKEVINYAENHGFSLHNKQGFIITLKK